MKENCGITLVALVITVIVLIILAGVSIMALTSDNGILSKANIAKVETNKANIKEQVQIAVIASYDNNGKLNIDKLKTELGKIDKIESITDTEGSFPVNAIIDKQEITIDENGKIILKDELLEQGGEKFDEKDQEIENLQSIINDLNIKIEQLEENKQQEINQSYTKGYNAGKKATVPKILDCIKVVQEITIPYNTQKITINEDGNYIIIFSGGYNYTNSAMLGAGSIIIGNKQPSYFYRKGGTCAYNGGGFSAITNTEYIKAGTTIYGTLNNSNSGTNAKNGYAHLSLLVIKVE